MAKINLLSKDIAELIAAGEVIERPASVIKELCENSIDAGATVITVEIKNGGITFMRVTDNGSGIAKEDVKTAFLRHATSKITTAEDLESIFTLGFRGEALASICAVSRVEILTAQSGKSGVKYVISGGEELSFDDAGCPVGTTIIVRDLFFNTPARMKFLKKDITEGNSIAQIVERLALSHPEISFKLIRDGKLILNTFGDGKLISAIYSVLGKDYSKMMMEVKTSDEIINVSGFVCSPSMCKPSRSGQYFFVNNRFVRSVTAMTAVEQAYKNSAMVGKFPAFVLFLKLPPNTVDVNVHPAKTEVRFSDERLVFDSIYRAVKNTILSRDERPEITIKKPIQTFEKDVAEQSKIVVEELGNAAPLNIFSRREIKEDIVEKMSNITKKDSLTSGFLNDEGSAPIETNKTEKDSDFDEYKLRVVGEIFKTYIIVEYEDTVYFIDKHAAHERIIFNSLNENINEQLLLTPFVMQLEPELYSEVLLNLDFLSKFGFSLEDYGSRSIAVRGVPSVITHDFSSVIIEIAEKLKNHKLPITEKEESVLHSVSCKAAIKAGDNTTFNEMVEIAKKVLSDKDVMYCPHGRTVALKMSKYEIEKNFGRKQ